MFKKFLPACLVVASAFVLFACSKDDAPAKTPETIKNASDSAISGVYFRCNYKGYTELYKHPVDSVGFYHYQNNYIIITWEGEEAIHTTIPEFNFGNTWPAGTGIFDSATFALSVADTNYLGKNIEYTIKRNGGIGDTVEVSFKGIITQENATGTPAVTAITGDFRAVRVELDHF